MDAGEKKTAIPKDFIKHLADQSIFKWDGVVPPCWKIEITETGVTAFIQWKNNEKTEKKKESKKRKYDQISKGQKTSERSASKSLPEETEEIIVKEEPADEFYTGEEKIEEIKNEFDGSSQFISIDIPSPSSLEALVYKNGSLTRLMAIREEIDRGLNLSKVIRRLMNIVFAKEELLVESIKDVNSEKIEMIVKEAQRWYNCRSTEVRQIISFRLSEIRKTNYGKFTRSNGVTIDDLRRMQQPFRTILPKPEPIFQEEATVTELD
ncbi:Oidioi.mRNA.OKI2018_I69.chr1.g213.t1.cds [Oikopleura dioica]|uniref:Oidioi.mRNA.OKI2018_I69.chr1.g213.t1.cds n=1 Tax=Oikopleura dioica TaxID=34765 RepID=A0ABN7SP86_OIKDI|nr:Oidioi.mRNA.OKI2018_I69.chr1.g213.t1.cds [Oikopleura dioica]